MSRAGLVRKLNKLGYMTDEAHHHADFYYVMSVKVINDAEPRISLRIEDVNAMNGNDNFSPHSPKVLPLDLIVADTAQPN